MRKILLTLLFVLSGTLISAAQEEAEVDNSFEAAYAACLNLRDAVADNDTTAISEASKDLKEQKIAPFASLRNKDDQAPESLNGHMVFDYEFADALLEGKDAYQEADSVSRSTASRGRTANGSILTKTCMVKAGKSTKYTFSSKGKQDLAVIAEPGGLLTMKIHVTNSAGLDQRYDDTKNVKKGMPQRKTSFSLPTDRRNIVELEVVNCGKKDTSFVIISN